MNIIVQAFNNDEYIEETDFIILKVSDENKKFIAELYHKIRDTFDKYNFEALAEVRINGNFEVYSSALLDEHKDTLSEEIIHWLKNPSGEYRRELILTEPYTKESIPTSEEFNGIPLEAYCLLIDRHGVSCRAWGKYDQSFEITSSEIDINKFL